MTSDETDNVECRICHNRFPLASVVAAAMIRSSVTDLIRSEHPSWSNNDHVCLPDLNHYRALYVQQMLETERGELSSLDDEVVQSLREHELLAANVNEQFDESTTMGDRVADHVAKFGGSWTFIIAFGTVLALWIIINTHFLMSRPIDPFPFIFLNLILSCLAAIQAPVIMMSQNRQGIKDRLQAEHDYKVNLKAELEIRHLHSKLDLMMTHQWQRLLEIQQVQTDLLEELAEQRGAARNVAPRENTKPASGAEDQNSG